MERILHGRTLRGRNLRARQTALAAPESLESRLALAADPSLADQWGLAAIDAPDAWRQTTGSSNVVVAIIDSGIDFNHPDLAANIWTNPREVAGNGRDDDGNGYVDDVHGWDFVSNDNVPQDGFWHGTHVAGIIGAVGDNGIGISGVSQHVSLLPVRVQNDSGSGYLGAAVTAINYVTRLRLAGAPIAAINISWVAGTAVQTSLQTAIQAAGSAGIIVVTASGNNASDNDAVPRYPSSYASDNVIAVAGSDGADSLLGISNYGATSVDLAAPGAGILSTLPGGGYGAISGTSMAAPFVTGTVALLASARPNASVAQIRSALLGSVDQVPALAGKVATGGRLNAFAALGRLAAAVPVPGPVVPPAPPAPVPAPVPVPPPVPPIVSTLLHSDTFTRRDSSTLPAPWQQFAGRLGIAKNQLVTRADATSLAIVSGVSAVDVSVASWVAVGKKGSAGLVARATGGLSGSMYYGSLTRTTSGVEARIWRIEGGVWTVLASQAVSTSKGQLEFRVVGTRLSLAFNGRDLLAVDDSAIRGAGGVGYLFQRSGGKADGFTATRR